MRIDRKNTDPAYWDALLAAEGMPAEIRPLTRTSNADPAHADALVVVGPPEHAPADWAEHISLTTLGPNEHGEALRLRDTDTARHWRAFSAAIWRADRDKALSRRHLNLLLAYADHGNLLRASRETGMTRKAARVALARFAAWRGSC